MDPKIQYDEADSRIFDYIIIGGGTAGLTLAARLTEDPDIEVAVLKAGEERLDVSPCSLTSTLPLPNTLVGSQNSYPSSHDKFVRRVGLNHICVLNCKTEV